MRGSSLRWLIATAGVSLMFAVLPAAVFAASPPVIESESAASITSTDATLGTQIDTENLYTAYEFEIDTNASYNYTKADCPLPVPGYAQCASITDGEPLPAGLVEPSPEGIPVGSGIESVSLDLASIGATLQPATTYHYRVIASNGGQVVEGPDQTFTTLLASATTGEPSIEGVSAAHVTDTDGTLEAQINSGGLDTSYEFYLEYPSCFSDGPGFCEASGGKEIASGTIPAGSSPQTVSEDVAAAIGHSLLPDRTYGYRVVASNAAGTKYSGLHAFTTLPGKAPVIESVLVLHLTPTDATLEATIDTEGLPTSYEFTMLNSPCSKKGAGCELIREIPLPSGGRLYGSFASQAVSLDLNGAGVTLGEGEYDFSVRATNAAGSTSADGGVFEAPLGVVDPLGPTVAPGPIGTTPGATNNGGQSPGSSSSSATTPGTSIAVGVSSKTGAGAMGGKPKAKQGKHHKRKHHGKKAPKHTARSKKHKG